MDAIRIVDKHYLYENSGSEVLSALDELSTDDTDDEAPEDDEEDDDTEGCMILLLNNHGDWWLKAVRCQTLNNLLR